MSGQVTKPKTRKNSEKRKAKSRDAARVRRATECSIFSEMAMLLPITREARDKLDKISILKLAVSFIKNGSDNFQEMSSLDDVISETSLTSTQQALLELNRSFPKLPKPTVQFTQESPLAIVSPLVDYNKTVSPSIPERICAPLSAPVSCPASTSLILQGNENCGQSLFLSPNNNNNNNNNNQGNCLMINTEQKITSTDSVFAPRTDDMNNGFILLAPQTNNRGKLTSIDSEGNCIVVAEIDPSDPAHDLTHLAPEAGDSFSCYAYDDNNVLDTLDQLGYNYDYSALLDYPVNQESRLDSSLDYSLNSCPSSTTWLMPTPYSKSTFSELQPEVVLESKKDSHSCSSDSILAADSSSETGCEGDVVNGVCFVPSSPLDTGVTSCLDSSLSCSASSSTSVSYDSAPSSVSSSFLVTQVGVLTEKRRQEQEISSSSSFPRRESLATYSSETTRAEASLSTAAKSSTDEEDYPHDGNSLILSCHSLPASQYSFQEKSINNHLLTTHLEAYSKGKFQEEAKSHRQEEKICLPLDLYSLPVLEDMDDLLRDIGILVPRNKTGKRTLDDLTSQDSCLQTSNVTANITVSSSPDDSASFTQSSMKQQQMSIDPSMKVFHTTMMSSSGKASSDLAIKRRRDGNPISLQEDNKVNNKVSIQTNDTEDTGRMSPDTGNDSGMGSTGKIEALFDSSSNSSSNMGDIYSLIRGESTSQERPSFSPSPILDDEDVMMSSSCVGQTNYHPVESSVWDSPPSTSDNTFSCFNTDSLENMYSSQVNNNNNHANNINHGINRDIIITNNNSGTSSGNLNNNMHTNNVSRSRDLEVIDPDFPFLSDDSLWDSFIDMPDMASNMMIGDQDVFNDNSSSFVSPLMSSLNSGMNSISGKNSLGDPLVPSSMICKPPPTLPLTSSLAMLLQEKRPSVPMTPVSVTKKLLTTISSSSTNNHPKTNNNNNSNSNNLQTTSTAVKNAVKNGTNSTSICHLNTSTHNLVVQNRQATHAVRLGQGITLTFAPNNASFGSKQQFVLTTTSGSTNTTNLIPFARKIVRVNGIRQTTASGTTAFIKNGSLTVSPTTSSLTCSTTLSSTAQGKSFASSTSNLSSKETTKNHNNNIMSKTSSTSKSDSSLAAPIPVKGNSVLMNLLVNGEDVTNGYSKGKSFANTNSNNHCRSRTPQGFHKTMNFSGSSVYSSSSSSSSSPGSSSPLSFSPLLSSAAMITDGECNFFDTFSTNTSVDPF